MGAWIEMVKIKKDLTYKRVAPHMGAWIEITDVATKLHELKSHPTWVRGLK